MVVSHYPDYLFSKKINNINNTILVKDCLNIEEMLIKTFPKVEASWHGSLTTAHHQRYNLLTFPTKEINKLYFELQKTIFPYLENKIYYIKSWLNVFRQGQKVDWHDHWASEKKVWHGFYCAQVGKSYTEYKIPNIKKTIKIISKEGLIVFGKSEGDKHRSSEWKEKNYPRITLAFDIIPLDSIESKLQGNHFIPFKNESNI